MNNFKKILVEMAKASVLSQIENLIKGNKRFNVWINDGNIKVYVRNTFRYLFEIGEQRIASFDLANIEVKKKGKGTFNQFLDDLIKLLKKNRKIDVLYVEQVHEQRLNAFLLRKGFNQTAPDNSGISSYYYKLGP